MGNQTLPNFGCIAEVSGIKAFRGDMVRLKNSIRACAITALVALIGGASLSAAAGSTSSTAAQLDSEYRSARPANSRVATSLVATETRSCGLWYFGNLGSKCLSYNNTTPGVGYAGAQGPQAPHCPTIPVGAVTTALTPPAGGSACFQFVASGSVTMPVEVSLPSNVTGVAELFVIYPNTGGFKLAEARTGTPLATNFSLTNQRIGVVFRPFTGPGGQNFNIGVNVAAPAAPSALNDTSAASAIVDLNRAVASTITTPGSSQGFYFYPLDAGQTTANYNVQFTSNQTAAIRPAQFLAPGTYAVGTETVLPLSKSGVNTTVATGLPANAPGTTMPYGLMVRVAGNNAGAPTDEPYGVRLSTSSSWLYTNSTSNTENISRYFPISGAIQVATYLTVQSIIKDAAGNLVPNETVFYDFKQDKNGSTVQTLTGVTDQYGSVTVTGTFVACTGLVISATGYGPPGSPADHWNGTAQEGTVTIRLPNSTPAPGTGLSTSTIPFTRICTETYRGRS